MEPYIKDAYGITKQEIGVSSLPHPPGYKTQGLHSLTVGCDTLPRIPGIDADG